VTSVAALARVIVGRDGRVPLSSFVADDFVVGSTIFPYTLERAISCGLRSITLCGKQLLVIENYYCITTDHITRELLSGSRAIVDRVILVDNWPNLVSYPRIEVISRIPRYTHLVDRVIEGIRLIAGFPVNCSYDWKTSARP
jgi:hypothetical protein